MTAQTYTGRFAPSPTGPLHFGSLLAACASYLDARANGGRWLLRIEDIDPPRAVPGADEDIVSTLDAFGFEWDDDVIYQSHSHEAHHAALDRLTDKGLLYRCDCSRRTLADEPVGELGTLYPGTCRTRKVGEDSAVRLTVDGSVSFDDELQGLQTMDLDEESGDFIVRRRDGLIAYHLAVVVDDALQGVTHIVRGIDLMPSTHRQRFVQQCLDIPSPHYAHIPVAVHANGDKLSKLTGAKRVASDSDETRRRALLDALHALRQSPPDELRSAALEEIWSWGIKNWNLQALHGLERVETTEKRYV